MLQKTGRKFDVKIALLYELFTQVILWGFLIGIIRFSYSPDYNAIRPELNHQVGQLVLLCNVKIAC